MFAVATPIGFGSRITALLPQIVRHRSADYCGAAVVSDLFVPVERFQEPLVKGDVDGFHAVLSVDEPDA